MFYVKRLSDEELLTLKSMFKNHPSDVSRMRAQAVLLSSEGFNLKDLATVFSVCRQTTSTWLHSWEENGICGLLDDLRSGRPCKLSLQQKLEAIDLVKQSPRSLKTVLQQLFDKFDIKLSCSTLKRVCRQARLCWKRVRRSLKAKRDPDLFERSRLELALLSMQARDELIDLRYFDQSGFTLEPSVPYAWQTIGTTIELPCSKSKRLNVLGLMGKDCSFQSWVFDSSINSSVVVAFFDQLAESINRPMAVVIDNASIHTSGEFTENIEKWANKGLVIVKIPPYSPELNLIEILWRKIKYEWMPFSAYQSFQNLQECLFEILANIGKSYTIEFA